jgi:hypothetical protein
VESVIAQVLNRFGRMDAVHNNVWVAHLSLPLHETSEAEWDHLLRLQPARRQAHMREVRRHGRGSDCATSITCSVCAWILLPVSRDFRGESEPARVHYEALTAEETDQGEPQFAGKFYGQAAGRGD